ncbi:MAG: hypothetical protein KatS3mg090_0448 [Patescibacteria group bacterium]|nr:MAG: hypothetical protein KatS3mg090_0448 [Patescibacteria group bacterium]
MSEDFKKELQERHDNKNNLLRLYGWFLCFIQNDKVFKTEFRRRFEELGIRILEKCNVTAEVGPVIFYRKKPSLSKPIISQEEFDNLEIKHLDKKAKNRMEYKKIFLNLTLL